MSQSGELLLIKDIVVAVAAFSGMGMSFYNLWSERQKEKVRLTVVPKAVKEYGCTEFGQEYAITTKNEFIGESSANLFAIEVINLSKFDVTVDEVGFLYEHEVRRCVIPNPIIKDGGAWPRKLEPRAGVTVYCHLSSLMQSFNVPKIKCAYAETACQEINTGSSVALKELVNSSKRFA